MSMSRFDNGTLIPNVPLRVSFTYNSTSLRKSDDSKPHDNSVNPAWHRSAALVSGTDVAPLKLFAPDMAAYLNEVRLRVVLA